LCASFDATHAGRTARLSKLLFERSFALKNGAGDAWLAPIEKQLAETAVSIATARVQYAGEINYELKKQAGENFSGIRNISSFITLTGWFEDRLTSGRTASDAELDYFGYLNQNRQLSGDKMVVDGAHKSDFSMFDVTLDKPTHITSTGQQKMALLALILAHARLIRSKTGAAPVILLDEVAAHLDIRARTQLFQELTATGAQVWATGIEHAMFKNITDALFITCDNGTVSLT
jgi:DNA replication and repair protein RecF